MATTNIMSADGERMVKCDWCGDVTWASETTWYKGHDVCADCIT